MISIKSFLLTTFIVLFLLSNTISVTEKTIDKINKENLDEVVKVKGSITKLINTDKVMIIEVTQPQNINIVLFKDKNKINLQEGDYIEVIGRIEEYNGEMEVIGSRVRVIS